MSQYDIQAIDVVVNLFTPEIVASRPSWTQDFFSNKVKTTGEIQKGVSVERMLDMMDEAGIEKGLLIAAKLGPPGHPSNWRLSLKTVADVVNQYPDRLYGLAGVDPYEGMRGVKELEYAVRNLGFVGAQLYPHWFELAPDHPKYYPFYAKCCELDVPMQMQVGHCLRYSKDRPLKSVGRPITLDTIACDFPELKLIGSHIGFPWVDEMISVAYKHPNVYISSDAYAPKHWPANFVHFINTWGKEKVLYGTDFAVIPFERSRVEVEALNLRPDAKQLFMRDNALRVYNLNHH
jgi:predicted TIM-barrel fold metal-dependent hydrolase